MTTTAIPPGYRKDAQGRLVAEVNIKKIDLLRDQLVTEIVDRAKTVSHTLTAFKAKCFDDIAAFTELSAEQYGVRLGGQKGNVTLLSFDGHFKVIRAVAEHITFDERLQAAKELIDACLHEWTLNARSEVRTLVQDAFRVDQAGKLQTERILALRRLDINDGRWLQAMRAISEAVQVTGSKSYVRVYERNDATGEYRPIPLGVTGA